MSLSLSAVDFPLVHSNPSLLLFPFNISLDFLSQPCLLFLLASLLACADLFRGSDGPHFVLASAFSRLSSPLLS